MGAKQSSQRSGPQTNGIISGTFVRGLRNIVRISSSSGQSSQPKIQRKECVSCFEDKPLSQYIYASRGCRREHRPDVCSRCYRAWIQSSIEEHGARITCAQCTTELRSFEIAKFVDRDTFDRWKMLAAVAMIEGDPDFAWCAHGCGSGQLREGGENVMMCNYCHRSTCLVHRLPWHIGLTCQEFDAKLLQEEPGMIERLRLLDDSLQPGAREESASIRLMIGITKRCPGCGVHIQKNGGCDRMRCVKCDKIFLWSKVKPIFAQ
ncbi:hypothetical protein F5Y09DRAFT_338817 [Xylaria sp. FL1042]|nr:hypothetical protein F5Y09DRAFT_338817 [Xylaria sp. FL1042]